MSLLTPTASPSAPSTPSTTNYERAWASISPYARDHPLYCNTCSADAQFHPDTKHHVFRCQTCGQEYDVWKIQRLVQADSEPGPDPDAEGGAHGRTSLSGRLGLGEVRKSARRAGRGNLTMEDIEEDKDYDEDEDEDFVPRAIDEEEDLEDEEEYDEVDPDDEINADGGGSSSDDSDLF